MRIKNLIGVSEVRLKKLDSITLEMSKNHLIRTFLRNGHLRVNIIYDYFFRILVCDDLTKKLSKLFIFFNLISSNNLENHLNQNMILT